MPTQKYLARLPYTSLRIDVGGPRDLKLGSHSLKMPDNVVFLFDCDNTLLDNDRVEVDLRTHLEREFGPRNRDRYWAILEALRADLGYADYLGALQRYRLGAMNDPRLLQMSAFLVNLEAMGIGTGSVECLTSYVSRLAAAHCLSPAVLLGRTFAPLIGKKYWLQGGARPGTRGSALGNSFSTHAKAVNGTGVIAKDWVRVIEGLTMRNDLRFLTMLPWANALTCRYLLRPTRAWCPSCYGEWRANDQIVYDPLLWALSEVQVCLRHQRRLRFQCHHCARNLPWLGRRTLPGHCSKCGNWLGVDFSGHSTDAAPADDELAWQTWVVKNLEEMIVAATHLPSPPKERITKALSLCIDQVTDGIMNRFACLIGKRKNTVWGWQHGKAKIPMGDLLRICDRVGVSLVDFLHTEFVTQNEFELIPTRFPFSGVKTTRRRPTPFVRETTECALRTFIKAHPPLPMEEVARKLKTDKRSLYKHFPSLCRAISARHVKDRKTYYEKLRSQQEKDIRHVRSKLRASGIYPSRRRVAALITKPAGFRYSSSGEALPVRDLQIEA